MNHFARRHKFVTEQSFSTYTTSQRRAFERDIYDYSRALGFAKSRAKASVLSARRLCGEEHYDSDDTRLDDDELDDSSVILVSLPASTCPEMSNLGRSFSATSPTIPQSSHPRRSASHILPSVEIQETPTSDVAQSEKTGKRRASSSTQQRGKRRRTGQATVGGSTQNNDSDTVTGTKTANSPTKQGSPGPNRQQGKPQHENPTKATNVNGPVLQNQSKKRVTEEKPPTHGEHPGAPAKGKAKQGNGKTKKGKIDGHTSDNSPPDSLKAERKERKRQRRKTGRPSVPNGSSDPQVSTAGLNGTSKLKPSEEIDLADSKRLLYEEQSTSSEVDKHQLKDSQQHSGSPGPQEKAKQAADDTDNHNQDQGISMWARELLRTQDAARRAREEKEKADMVRAEEVKLQDQEDAISADRKDEKDQKARKSGQKKKERQPDGMSSTPTGFQSPMIQPA